MERSRVGKMVASPFLKLFLLIVLLLATQPTLVGLSEGANGLNTPVYSDFSVVVPDAAASATEALESNQPFEGTAEAVLEPRFAETEAEFLELLAREPKTAPTGIETILGADERVRWYTGNYPARALTLITFNQGASSYTCSGVLIGKDTVLTAGHCVHSGGSSGVWSSSVVVYPGRDGTSSPYGSCGSSWLASVTGWTNNANEQYDYGVVKLNCDVGNTVGWYGFWWQSASLNNTPTIVSGYPGDKPLELWASFDIVRVTQTYQTFYKADTIGGMSGSPAWQPRPSGSSYCANGPCVHTVHAYGLHGSSPHSTHNHGTRITKDRYNNLVNWKNASK